jgi:hypothetical protein
MKKFQPKHFQIGLKNYEVDVVSTFVEYFKHLPDDMDDFFLTPIPAPSSLVWYAKVPMGIKPLRSMMKELCVENGLDPGQFLNKSGRTTLVTRMS